jgi:hypothetical protein
MAEIRLSSGAVIRTHKAPDRHFDPISADISTLKSLGLPLPPEGNPARFERWKSVVGRKLEYIEAEIHLVQGTRKERKALLANPTSNNWSGCVTQIRQANDMYMSVSAEWNVPSVVAPQPPTGQPTNCSVWIGIDGTNGSTDVFQAGVRCDVLASGATEYYAWVEWFPDGEAKISNFPISPGDHLEVTVNAYDSTNGIIRIQNLTQSKQTSSTISPPPGSKLIGNTAEWIVERPTINGNLSTLANYGSVQFSFAELQGNETTNPFKHFLLDAGDFGVANDMTNDRNTVVSNAVIVDRTTIKCFYVGT